jgi:predicted AAA+ superfamily ATPase
MMYQRTLQQTIRAVSESFPVLMLTGPRQVGKTTLLEMCSEGQRAYVTLDDLDARNRARCLRRRSLNPGHPAL